MEESLMGRHKVSDTQVSIRLPEELAERAVKLSDRLYEEEPFRAAHPSGMPTAAVFRLALMRGLDELEKEFPTTKRGRK